MEKHAFLIMAHKNDHVLQTLLHMLDNEQNDIFIHMDLKNTAYHAEELNITTCSKVFFVDRVRVNWGGYSQIRAELNLLQEARKRGPYKYYHLLSGADLPIKSQKYIYDFFERNAGKEFVGFCGEKLEDESRVKLYHIFQEKIGRGKKFNVKLNRGFLKLQRILKIDRISKLDVCFMKGPNWFSITDRLASVVIDEEEWIKKIFRNTTCCDEVFLQTIIKKRNMLDKVYCLKNSDDNAAAMRYIDWDRGTPYIFRIEDFKALVESQLLFARKFDEEVDSQIIDCLYIYCMR